MSELRTSRRIVFHGLGALGVAVALAGCGGGDESSSTPRSTGGTTPDTTPDTEPSSPPDAGSTESSPATGEEAPADGLVATAEVPVGGGVVLLDDNIVVVQPTEGTFLAYNASCTHQGTQVVVDDEGIYCPNHGSRFSSEDGAPTVGPATAPLAEVAVTVVGDQVVAA